MRRLGLGPLELAVGLSAALPVIVSAAHAVTVGWVPLGDDAVIAARSYDVPTTHAPLLGQFSASSGILGNGPQSSLGPMLYWLLAIPARLFEPSALVATVGLVATASIVGCVILARRRGGDAFMVATAIGIAVAARSIDPETLSDIWNPAAALFPLLLLMFVSWSVASGEVRLLPVAVVLASFVAQCHLAYVLPALGMLAVAAGGLWLAPPPGVRRALVPAAVAALVCWSAPLVEQAIHRPGNLVQVARSATAGEPTFGLSAGWHTVVRTAGLDAWWLRAPRPPADRLGDIVARPGAAGIVTAVAMLAVLAAAAAAGLRRRHAELAAAGTLGLLLCLAAGATAASTPSKGNLFISVGYTLWWASFAGMFATLLAGWSAAQLLRGRLRIALPAATGRAAALTGIAAVLAAGALVAARTGAESLQSAYRPVRQAVDRLARDRRPALVTLGTPNEFVLQSDVQAGLVYGLRREGVRVMATGLTIGHWYQPGKAKAERDVIISSPSAARGSVVNAMRIRQVAYRQRATPRMFRTIVVSAAPVR
jgi:hypothetical protein